jgi:Protein of unknown function (DUF3309)
MAIRTASKSARDSDLVHHHRSQNSEANLVAMSTGTILIILLILLLVGAFPRWGYSTNWGYGPSGILGILLIIVIVLLLTGHL